MKICLLKEISINNKSIKTYLNKMNCYAVIAYGNTWNKIIGICATKREASRLRDEALIKYEQTDCKIGLSKWIQMCEHYENVGDDENTFIEEMVKLFPEYSKEDIEEAENCYDSADDFINVKIEEVKYYGTK